MSLKKFLLCLFLSLLTINYLPVYCEDDLYCVYSNDMYEEFNTFNDAYYYYEDNIDNYDNLVLKHNDEVIEMEYGVVKFIYEEPIKYHSIIKNEDDYLVSSYGVDAAYLYQDNEKIYFMISGDIGCVDINMVELIPFNELKVKPSLYISDDKYLYHNIKNQLDYEYCNDSYKLDFIIDELCKNSEYYSYDGHFFYDDFYLMIDDYRSNNNDNALNETPYYNYYQYLSHHSLTSYNYRELEDYFYQVLGIDNKLIHYLDDNGDGAADEINRSQIYDEINDFFAYESIYGTNALMLISSAIHESSYGRSERSFINNNLYFTSAYDSYLENSNDRYTSVDNSIYAHSKYLINKRFSNHKRNDYKGTNFGNKVGGINVNYAIDQYYGEKLASIYFGIDNKLGLRDYQKYPIGLIIDNDRVNFYRDDKLEDRMFYLEDISELSLVILNESDEAYKVQIDYSFDDEYLYDFNKSVAYISKDEVEYILNKDKKVDHEFINVLYDFNGGSFIDKDTLELKVKNDDIDNLKFIKPNKDGYEFIDYESVIDIDTHYLLASYKKIDSITIENLVNNLFLDKAILNVNYEDGSSNKISITSDMVECFDNEEGENIVTVNYCGLTTSISVDIDNEYYEIMNNLKEAIDSLDYEYVRENSMNINYPFTMDDIRSLDLYFKDKQNRNYYIKSNIDGDFSISGLDFSINNYNDNFTFFKNTYYVLLDNASYMNRLKVESVTSGYGFKYVDGFNISFKYNYVDIDLQNPVVVQVDIKNKKNNCIYVVYHIDDNGDVVKCKTTWSNNYVQFITDEDGDYIVLSLDSFNTYDIEDKVENLNIDNMGYDNHKLNIEVMNISVLYVITFIGVIIYYIVEDKSRRQWKDFKRLLLHQDTVVEEKLKS